MAKEEKKPKKAPKAEKPAEPEKVARPAPAGEAAQAFERMTPLIDAVQDKDLAKINIDIPRAVSTVLGALPAIESYRGQLKELPYIDQKQIDLLRDLTFAAWYAHLAASPTVSESQKAELIEKISPLREGMLIQAEALAHVGLLDKATVANIRAGSGNLDKANDAVALAALFSMAWDRVVGKTTVTLDDIELAADLGPQLIIALSDKPTNIATTDAAKARLRAFTLFVNAYDQARRGISFLRWNEDDAKTIAPSLYSGKKKKSKEGEEDDEPEEPQGTGQG